MDDDYRKRKNKKQQCRVYGKVREGKYPEFSKKVYNFKNGDGRSKKEGTYIYLWLIHVDVWQKPTQYCKVIIC